MIDIGKKWNEFVRKKGISHELKGFQLESYLRQSINSPVQSGAADIVTKAMLHIWKNERLKQLGFKLLLNIHDEVILEGPKEFTDEAVEIIRKCMEEPWEGMPKKIEFKIDVKASANWFDAK